MFKRRTLRRLLGIAAVLVTALVAAAYWRRREAFTTPSPPPPAKVSVPTYAIREIDNFLSAEECDRLITLSTPHLETSNVYRGEKDAYDSSYRESRQAWLKDAADPLVADLSRRVAADAKMPVSHQEDLQVVSYGRGGFFTPHHDACDGLADFCDRMNGASGPRLWTYLIYLNDDFTGGETVFPKLGRSVKPKKGKCVVFQSIASATDARLIEEALHGGDPVQSGTKWICNKWIRVRPFVAT